MPWQEEPRGSYPGPEFLGLSGIDQMRTGPLGKFPTPPIHHLTGMIPTEAGLGRTTFTMPATPWLQSPPGMISGGTLAILADGPLGTAIQTALPPATVYTTQELSMSFLRAATPASGMLTARGRLIHGGRSIGLSEVEVIDATGRLLAHGTSRCFIFPPMDIPHTDLDDLPEIDPVAYETPDPYERPVMGEVISQEEWDAHSGGELLAAGLDGTGPAPPIYYLTGLRPVELGGDWAKFVLPSTVWHTSPTGKMEGGFIAMLADAAMASAVQVTLPAGTAYATLDLKVNFVRPVDPDGRDITATGTILHRGKTIAVARAEVHNADGKLVALATGSSMILPGPWSSIVRQALTPDES